MKFAILWLLLVQAVFAELIPARRLNSWVPGVDVGVPGGIPTNRTNLLNVVTTYGADPTGASDSKTAIQNAVNAASTNDVVYLPVGVYRINSGINSSYKDDFTIRGQGTSEGDGFVLSRTPNSIGTGTKTFTVPAGLPYTAGVGVWVWKWDRNDARISSITRSGSTATVTTMVQNPTTGSWAVGPHLRSTGEQVAIMGATQNEYNGSHTITVTSDSTFTYPVSGTPASPATT